MISFLEFLSESKEKTPLILLDEGIANPAMHKDKKVRILDREIRKIAALPDNVKPKESTVNLVTSLTKDLYQKYEPKLKSIQPKLVDMVKSSYRGKSPTIKSRIKPLRSVLDKTIKRKKEFGSTNDLLGAAILLDDKDEVDDYVKRFIRKNKKNVKAVEEKVPGGKNEYGYYGAFHIDVEIDGMINELQVMTKRLWQKKGVAHTIYTTSRSRKGGATPHEKMMSRKIFRKGNIGEDVLLVIEEVEAELAEEYGV